MTRIRRWLIALEALPLLCLLSSCADTDSPRSADTDQQPVMQGQIITDPQQERAINPETKLVECAQAEAEFFLVVEVNFPGVLGKRFYSFPMKQQRLYDDRGFRRFVLTSKRCVLECADGGTPDGHGFGSVTGVNLTDSTASEASVKVSCSWKAPDQTRGAFEKVITVPLGDIIEGSLSDTATFQASWREAPK